MQTYITVILISVIAVQYAFALFCLLKLAFFDISKREYVLWNLFILIVFFIGGAAFLVYYFKHPDKHIQKQPEADGAQTADENAEPEKEAATEAVEKQADEVDVPHEEGGDIAEAFDDAETAEKADEPQDGEKGKKGE